MTSLSRKIKLARKTRTTTWKRERTSHKEEREQEEVDKHVNREGRITPAKKSTAH